MKFVLLAAATVMTATGVLALPAMADDDDLSPARLERLDQRAKERGFPTTRAKAVEIAKSHGLVTLREVDLEYNDEWKIEGRDADGREIEVELSARDGKVREIDRD